jgi:hypothetical protein
MKKRKFFIDVIALLFVLLFAYTAKDKLMHPSLFRDTIRKSIVVGKFADVLTYAVPIGEIGIIFLIIFSEIKGLIASLIVMSLFTIYVAYMLLFVSHLPCNCGGVISGMKWPVHLIFNIFWTLLAIIALRLHTRNKRESNPLTYEVATATA